MEKQAVDGHEFPKVEKYELVSPDFIVKSEAGMSKMVKGAQGLHVENDVLLAVD